MTRPGFKLGGKNNIKSPITSPVTSPITSPFGDKMNKPAFKLPGKGVKSPVTSPFGAKMTKPPNFKTLKSPITSPITKIESKQEPQPKTLTEKTKSPPKSVPKPTISTLEVNESSDDDEVIQAKKDINNNEPKLTAIKVPIPEENPVLLKKPVKTDNT